ncbi:choice-of-anchor J domain-containing protein [Flavobacterium sp.]|jgi:hypothetical protein|uniref:choice-of-anchor J domain-containing protein n=1 Tax=Flavobacterium sp. TaxID=239 RepID=UPI0037C085E7
MKKITLVFLFLLGTITATYGQFSESFDAGTTTPPGWSVINGGGANTFIFAVGAPGSAFSAPNAAQINYNVTAHDDYLVTPQITVTAGLNDRLTYYVKNQDPNPLYIEAYEVKLSTTTATAADFTVVVTPEADAPNAWTQFTIDLTPYVGQSIYIGFHAVSTDKFRLLFDNIVNDTPPTVAPNCVTLTAPINAATAVSPSPSVTLSWTAATTGTAAASYDVYLDTNTNPTTLLGNQVGLTRAVTGLLSLTTYYWKVVAKNAAGEATGCSVFSFTTSVDPFAPYCGPLAFATAVEPITLVNFAGINNTTSATVAGATAHEVFTSITGNVTAGSSYTITLKGNSDGNFTNRFIVFADWNQDGDFGDSDESYPITQTITNSTGLDAQQATQSLLVPPTATVGNTRMRVKKIFGTADFANPCLGAAYGQVEDYTLAVAAVPADLPDYANLQFPYTASIAEGGSVTVYGRVYEGGLTDTTSGQAPGINAWVGYSTTNANPNTFTTWIPATFSGEVDNGFGNPTANDEYQANIGASLTQGTYYYATRFQLNGGAYVYGGTNFGFWNGTDKINGVLTVTAATAPANDLCSGAIALTPGGVFADQDVNGTMLAATLTAGITPSCQATNIADVWYTVQVPASGSITIETQSAAANSLTDTVIAAFTDCDGLTALGCNDDGGPVGPNDFMSILSLTGQTPGSIIYVAVWKYGTVAPSLSSKDFIISAYDASLGNNSFDNANFSYYPNPVKNTLNLSYNKEISNVDVFNLLGQKVSSNKVNANDAQIDMSNVSKGAYMVKVTSDTEVKTIKVIKE